MSLSFDKYEVTALRRSEWPFRHDEFDEWPVHMRPPIHMRSRELAFDPVTMTAISLGATAAGTIAGGAGALSAGQNAQAMGRYQNLEYTQQAETATATGQRAMIDERRKTSLLESTVQARAAAGGGSATAPSTLNIQRNIAGRGEYSALMDLSQGENQAAGLTNMGQAARYGGQIAEIGDDYSAAGTIAQGAGSFASTYGRATGRIPPYGGYGYGGGQSVSSGLY